MPTIATSTSARRSVLRPPASLGDRESPANGRYEPQVEGDGASAPNQYSRAPTESAASLTADGDGLRHCEPEGRRRQDDDGRQRRGLHRRGRLRHAAGGHRPAGERDGGAGAAQGPRAERLRRPVRLGHRRGGAVADGHRQPRRPALASGSGGGQRRAPARGGLRAAPARGAGAAARPLLLHAPGLPAVARPAHGQRARRRRPRDRPGADASTTRSRAWPACSTRWASSSASSTRAWRWPECC